MIFMRQEKLIGKEGMKRLKSAHIAVFGLGGVGGYAAESLVRAGIGRIAFIDGDVVEESNLNRQIVATIDAVGQNKAELMARRAKSINPLIEATAIPFFYGRDEHNDYVNTSHFSPLTSHFIVVTVGF